MTWQLIDVERFSGLSAHPRGRHGDCDLMLSGRHGRGRGAGDAVVGANYDASADFSHRALFEPGRRLLPILSDAWTAGSPPVPKRLAKAKWRPSDCPIDAVHLGLDAV